MGEGAWDLRVGEPLKALEVLEHRHLASRVAVYDLGLVYDSRMSIDGKSVRLKLAKSKWK